MSPRKPSEHSGTMTEDQWELVATFTAAVSEEPHTWRLRQFKNQRGQHRIGVRCDLCGAVRVFTEREMRELDRKNGRGQY